MSYGFFLRGAANNVVIDQDNPVLRVEETGPITVNTAQIGWDGARVNPVPGAGAYCRVTYRTPARSQQPPLVFGIPSGSANDVVIGMFSHIGQAGNWTGFWLFFGSKLADVQYYSSGRLQRNTGRRFQLGDFTGWNYAVCAVTPGVAEKHDHGLRVFDDTGAGVVFDSNWSIAPFRNLLTGWEAAPRPYNPYPISAHGLTGGGFFTCYFGTAWGDWDADFVVEYYRHAWGAADGSLGVLISSLGTMSQWVDYGSHREMRTAPLIGFSGGVRDHIYCMLQFGWPQHKSATGGAGLNGYGLLTADFSQVRF